MKWDGSGGIFSSWHTKWNKSFYSGCKCQLQLLYVVLWWWYHFWEKCWITSEVELGSIKFCVNRLDLLEHFSVCQSRTFAPNRNHMDFLGWSSRFTRLFWLKVPITSVATYSCNGIVFLLSWQFCSGSGACCLRKAQSFEYNWLNITGKWHSNAVRLTDLISTYLQPFHSPHFSQWVDQSVACRSGQNNLFGDKPFSSSWLVYTIRFIHGANMKFEKYEMLEMIILAGTTFHLVKNL